MRGRKPIPVELKVVRGNPGHRTLPVVPETPKVSKRMKPPAGMSDDATAAWKKVAPMLQAAGLLHVPDVVALRLLCESYATWEKATELARGGFLVKASNGTPMASPYLHIASRAHDQIVKLLTEFGMTPSARTRVAMGRKGQADEAAASAVAADDASASKFFG
jgi:P27 family predicted phage terminase small subunit